MYYSIQELFYCSTLRALVHNKNVRSNIIKTILEYLPIPVSTTLKRWKAAITLVEQEYESIKRRQDYKTGSGIIYREKGLSINIGKAKDNYNKEGKFRCFNCNIHKHMSKDCWKLKKERKTKKCYKYNKVEYLTKDCRSGQKIKKYIGRVREWEQRC